MIKLLRRHSEKKTQQLPPDLPDYFSEQNDELNLAPNDEPGVGENEDAPDKLSREDIAQLRLMVRYWEQMADYLRMRAKPVRFIWLNLLSGMAKGLGSAIGITVIAFIAFKLLVGLQVLNLPFIGDFIAELIEYINNVQGIM